MGWFDSIKTPKIKNNKKPENAAETPAGVWQKCVNCSQLLQTDKIAENWQVCPYCQFHFRLGVHQRIKLLSDEKSFLPFSAKLISQDPLEFSDKQGYGKRLQEMTTQQGMNESVLAGSSKIASHPVALAVMDFKFMGGSMGVVCGEWIARTMDYAFEKKIPCIVVTSSGGARMQEGLLSLMQMAKTSSARHRLRKAAIPYISILTDPTTGGCAASFSFLGDFIIAEPNALIGFAGPRVIEQSIRQTLPEGFQRSEFLLEKGFLDRVVHRHQLKSEVSFLVSYFST